MMRIDLSPSTVGEMFIKSNHIAFGKWKTDGFKLAVLGLFFFLRLFTSSVARRILRKLKT